MSTEFTPQSEAERTKTRRKRTKGGEIYRTEVIQTGSYRTRCVSPQKDVILSVSRGTSGEPDNGVKNIAQSQKRPERVGLHTGGLYKREGTRKYCYCDQFDQYFKSIGDKCHSSIGPGSSSLSWQEPKKTTKTEGTFSLGLRNILFRVLNTFESEIKNHTCRVPFQSLCLVPILFTGWFLWCLVPVAGSPTERRNSSV